MEYPPNQYETSIVLAPELWRVLAKFLQGPQGLQKGAASLRCNLERRADFLGIAGLIPAELKGKLNNQMKMSLIYKGGMP